eukprot:Em0418g1a
MCSCKTGFGLSTNSKTCVDIDECQMNNGNCSHFCTNTNGSFTCSCRIGFALGGDNKTCTGYLPFVALERTVGVLSGTDDGYSYPIYSNQGIPFGTSIQYQAYVGANGIISFGAGYTSNNPQLFPTNNAVTRNAYVVAPFWSDNDLRLAGSVTYQVFTSQLADVNAFISDTTGTIFTGTWMLVAQWNGAHPFPHGSNPTSSALNVTNTYQAIVITDTIQSYAIFTYNCQLLQWVQSQFNYAVVGFNAGGTDYTNYNFSTTAQIGGIACNNSTYPWSNVVYNIGKIGTTLSDYQQYDASFQQPAVVVAGMCNLYFERRAPIANGDPHFTTLDGKTYTFNGWGEYKVVPTATGLHFPISSKNCTYCKHISNTFVGFAFGSIGSDYVECLKLEYPQLKTITGMLGNYNGDQNDDFALPNGTVLLPNSTDKQIYVFGQSSNYSYPAYAPAFLEDVLANASDAVKSACNNDPSCIFDYAQTGNMAIGLATLSTIAQKCYEQHNSL